jgi:glycosyltransferase involved in cell wall biosynthesis
VGDGELRPQIGEQAAALPEGSVLLTGTRTDIPRLLQAADVFAFPSRFEGFGITLLEAQAAGLPCIKADTITDDCIVTPLVKSLPIDDPKSWAEAMTAAGSTPREDQLPVIRASGFDLIAATEKLTRFYLNGETL